MWIYVSGGAVSSQLSHLLQEVLLAQFSLHVHKGDLKHHSFQLFYFRLEFGKESASSVTKSLVRMNSG